MKEIYQSAIGYANIETNSLSDTSSIYLSTDVSCIFAAIIIYKLIEENKRTLNTTLDNFYPSMSKNDKMKKLI